MFTVVGFFVVLGMTGCLGERYELKLMLEEDKVYELASEAEVAVEMELLGTQAEFEFASDSKYLMELEDVLVTDNYLLGGQISEVNVDLKRYDFTFDWFDEDELEDYTEEESRERELLTKEIASQLEGSEFSLVVDDRGRISSAEFDDYQYYAFEDDVSSLKGDENGDDTDWFFGEEGDFEGDEVFDDMYGGQFFKASWDYVLNSFPEKEVSIGDSWETSRNIEFADTDVTLIVEDEYTLKEIGDDKVIFDAGGEIYLEDEGLLFEDNLGLIDVKDVDISGSQEGEIILDKASGWLLESETKQSIKGRIIYESFGQEDTMVMELITTIHNTGEIT